MDNFMEWLDRRFPATQVWNDHMAKYWTPKNFNFWYYFGVLSIVILVLQIVTGIFLTMHYKPDVNLAFASVEYIMRDVPWGWLIRYLHAIGASAFFVVIYLHMFRGLIYGSSREPRELVWLIGCVIYVALMAESFMGYLLPWGNMSYWGAQVIISLFDVIPYVGPALSEWIRGDFVVSDATLNRFFAFHVIAVPLILCVLVFLHIVALHKVGSLNPDGIEIKENKDEKGIPLDGVAFHPYYTVKDTVGVVVFFIIYLGVVFYWPEGGGILLEKDNFAPANSLQTPPDIVPLWYFTPFYSILRASTTDFLVVLGSLTAVAAVATFFIKTKTSNKIAAFVGYAVIAICLFIFDAKWWGVVMMAMAIIVMFLLPWLDRSPVKSVRYRSLPFKIAVAIFVFAFISLGYLGMHPVSALSTIQAQTCTVLYFAFFALMPFYTTWGKTKPVPERLT